jgi:hypothetical protein
MKINEHGHKTQWVLKQELKILFKTLEAQIRCRIQIDKVNDEADDDAIRGPIVNDPLPHCLNTLQAIKDRIIL